MGKTWKELGLVGVKKKKVGRKCKDRLARVDYTPIVREVKPRTRGTVMKFENLGMKVEWVDGKVIIHRNGRTEVYNNFNELRVPSKKGVRLVDEPQVKPNAIYAEKNGVKYYFFPNLGVVVKSVISYWPEESEVQPPEHLFGRADLQEFSEVLKQAIESGKISGRAEREYRRYIEQKWRRDLQRAIDKVIRIIAKQKGYELPPKRIPVSYGLIEELRERGFEVRIKT